MPDYRRQVALALERQRRAEGQTKALERSAAATPASLLTVTDLAEAIGDALKDQRREIIEHCTRLLKLTETRRPEAARVEVLEDRFRKLLSRVGGIESELRRMQRGGSR